MMTTSSNLRQYDPKNCITFRKTNESFGGLSNMASGFVLWVNGTRILTSEALYQACRFPHLPEVQRSIIMQGSPMTAKMKSKPFRDQSRADWDQVRLKIMRWCLRVKLAQNWDAFSELLLRTGDKPIVEDSRKDRFWGAVMNEQGVLEGRNALGRLLMELREELKGANSEALRAVHPIAIPDFLLYGQPIGVVEAWPVKQDADSAGRRLKPLGTRRPDEPVKTYAPPAAKADLFSEPEQAMDVNDPKPQVPLSPYPAYKPAGVPWLQQVPVHWEVLPNRALFTEVKEPGRPEDEMLSVTIGRGVLKQAEHLATTTKKDSARKDKSTYKRVAEGDIVYNKMRAWQGAFGMSRFRGIVSPAYVVARPTEKACSEYYHYLFRTPLFAKEAERNSYGLASDIWNLRPEHFKTILNVCPPKEEQHLIVRYLHALDAKVKRYIRAKRSLIARLQEQKQAIIQRAVTRGLVPNVKLKPSGVVWLGEVPEHWEVRRIRAIAQFVTSGSRGWAEHYSNEGPVFLRIGNISTTSVDLKLKRIQRVTPPRGSEGERTRVNAGDVLLSITAQVGAVGVVPEGLGEAYVNQHTALIRLREGLCDSRWVAYVLLSGVGKDQCSLMFAGGTKEGLSLQDVKDLMVTFPLLEEQQRIVRRIDIEVDELEKIIGSAANEISLMNEYHTRLIADVVTGAVDVRAAAQALSADQMISGSDDQTMEEEPLSMAAEAETEYGAEE